mmetsp:Transcript_6531/g.23472  ORF Transcript_6531/g.23472 Transcript_6531/m.23472 type:complete len:256 (+) Transcript_6531:1667-2434(+)
MTDCLRIDCSSDMCIWPLASMLCLAISRADSPPARETIMSHSHISSETSTLDELHPSLHAPADPSFASSCDFFFCIWSSSDLSSCCRASLVAVSSLSFDVDVVYISSSSPHLPCTASHSLVSAVHSSSLLFSAFASFTKFSTCWSTCSAKLLDSENMSCRCLLFSLKLPRSCSRTSFTLSISVRALPSSLDLHSFHAWEVCCLQHLFSCCTSNFKLTSLSPVASWMASKIAGWFSLLLKCLSLSASWNFLWCTSP